MQVGLHCAEVSEACPYDVAGFSFSGVPGVVIGHNADIAWGFTNQGTDVSDLYLERIRGDEWRHGRGWRRLETRTETIEVAGGDDVEITVRSTAHGPVLSDADEAVDGVLDDVAGGPRADDEEIGVALQWTALRPSPTMDAVLELNRADDWDSFRGAAADLAAPAQNVVYADREGHIGYQATGVTPIRKSGNDGRMPVEGWLPENDWTDQVVPFDGLPNVLDPDSGLIVTANQAVTRPGYSYFLTGDYDLGFRSARISELLEKRDDLSADDLLAVQRDDRNPMAPVLVPYLLDLRLAHGYFSDGQQTLEGWDFRQPASGTGSAAAAYYNAVWRHLLRLTFDDELPQAAEADGSDRWMAVVAELLTDPGSAWWDDVDTDDVERRDDILRQAMRSARDELTSLQSPNPDEWTWGRLHALELRSSTLGESGIGVVERLFNRGGWDISGGSAIVAATSWDAREGYGVTSAPSMRMVVDLDDLDASRWVSLTGVSGHAFADHYTDQTDVFVAGDTLAWPFTPDAVEAAAEDELTLTPVAD
jgi:penicillin amidase